MARKPGAGAILFLAIILGLVTAVLIWNYLRKQKPPWEPVVVATSDIKPREKVTRDMITITRFPKELITQDAATDIKQVEGKITLNRIKAKEQVRMSDLAQEGTTPSLAYEIPEGMRAISIGAGEVMAVGATIKPGDRVDILATYHDPVARQETTKMILQNVPVLAINKGQTEAGKGEGATSSMTLAVKPEQTELIAAADRAGALRVTLRPVRDPNVVVSEGVTVKDLGGRKMIEEPSVQTGDESVTRIIISPPRTDREIVIFRGTNKELSAP